jgi:hypothetical protein
MLEQVVHVSGTEGKTDNSGVKMLSRKTTRYFILTFLNGKTKTKIGARAFLYLTKQFPVLF